MILIWLCLYDMFDTILHIFGIDVSCLGLIKGFSWNKSMQLVLHRWKSFLFFFWLLKSPQFMNQILSKHSYNPPVLTLPSWVPNSSAAPSSYIFFWFLECFLRNQLKTFLVIFSKFEENITFEIIGNLRLSIKGQHLGEHQKTSNSLVISTGNEYN